MNLWLLVAVPVQVEENLLVNLVHRCVTGIGGVVGGSLHGAAEENAEELVQVSQEHAGNCQIVRAKGSKVPTIEQSCRRWLACSS
jgi:hypothetical protein